MLFGCTMMQAGPERILFGVGMMVLHAQRYFSSSSAITLPSVALTP